MSRDRSIKGVRTRIRTLQGREAKLDTHHHRWTQASLKFRKSPRGRLCQYHLWLGYSIPADCVDHIVPHDGNHDRFWNEDNWQGLCYGCHNRKSNREAQGMIANWPLRDDRIVIYGKPASGKTTAAAHIRGTVWDWDVEAHRLGFDANYGFDGYPEHEKQILLAAREKFLKDHSEWVMIVHRMGTAYRLAQRYHARLVEAWCDENERQRRLVARANHTP